MILSDLFDFYQWFINDLMIFTNDLLMIYLIYLIFIWFIWFNDFY